MAVKLSKIIPWVVAVVLATTSGVSAQQRSQHMQKDQGHPVAEHEMMSAYNAPARIDVRGSWDFFITGTFLYWQAREEGLQYGLITDNQLNSLPFVNGRVANMKFKYKPAFKVGIGINTEHDDWDMYAEYTRFHSRISDSAFAPDINGTLGNIQALWLHPDNAGAFVDLFARATARWKLTIDILDVELARSFYNGKNLTMRGHFGARAAWIDQRFRATYTFTVSGDVTATRQSTDSWALGPRTGIDGNWILGEGFRLIGNGAVDILYTRYKTRIREQDPDDTSELNISINDKIAYLRTHLELQIGFGWGTYFDNNNWHFDLAATYDFHVFWNQGMFYKFFSEENEGDFKYKAKDLYLHGLTLTARFDF